MFRSETSDEEILRYLGSDRSPEDVGEKLMARFRGAYAKRLYPESFEKRCSKCGLTKSLDQYSPKGKCSPGSDGRRPDCKRCHSAFEAKRQRERAAEARRSSG